MLKCKALNHKSAVLIVLNRLLKRRQNDVGRRMRWDLRELGSERAEMGLDMIVFHIYTWKFLNIFLIGAKPKKMEM